MTYTIIAPDFALEKKRRISAAVSMPKSLYRRVTSSVLKPHEGNFSRYVRSLIKRDLNAA